jgi:hypothetical protein
MCPIRGHLFVLSTGNASKESRVRTTKRTGRRQKPLTAGHYAEPRSVPSTSWVSNWSRLGKGFSKRGPRLFKVPW